MLRYVPLVLAVGHQIRERKTDRRMERLIPGLFLVLLLYLVLSRWPYRWLDTFSPLSSCQEKSQGQTAQNDSGHPDSGVEASIAATLFI